MPATTTYAVRRNAGARRTLCTARYSTREAASRAAEWHRNLAAACGMSSHYTYDVVSVGVCR